MQRRCIIFDKRYFPVLLDESLRQRNPERLISLIVNDPVHVYRPHRQPPESRDSCNLHLQDEREAYRIQNHFISNAGYHYNVGRVL